MFIPDIRTDISEDSLSTRSIQYLSDILFWFFLSRKVREQMWNCRLRADGEERTSIFLEKKLETSAVDYPDEDWAVIKSLSTTS